MCILHSPGITDFSLKLQLLDFAGTIPDSLGLHSTKLSDCFMLTRSIFSARILYQSWLKMLNVYQLKLQQYQVYKALQMTAQYKAAHNIFHNPILAE